jgi:hypothetical protein
MTTSSILPVATNDSVREARRGAWTVASQTITPQVRVVEPPVQQVSIEIQPSGRRLGAGQETIRQKGGVSQEPRSEGVLKHSDANPSPSPSETTSDDQILVSRRMADKALFGLSAVLLAAFLWMCAGNDDLTSPLLIVSSWMVHALAIAVIAAMVVGLGYMVLRTPWTVRIVFVGILILNWVLKTLLG